jgi:hypothetical protein
VSYELRVGARPAGLRALVPAEFLLRSGNAPLRCAFGPSVMPGGLPVATSVAIPMGKKHHSNVAISPLTPLKPVIDVIDFMGMSPNCFY